MSDTLFKEFDIPAPPHSLTINSEGHGSMTGRMLTAIEEVIEAERPAMLLVNGDTNSTLVGALTVEAYFHCTPCVTLRDETEWLETVDAGWNRLWKGPDYAPRRDITECGTGQASETIAALLERAVG